MKKIMMVFGTRPEAIKFAPLMHEFRKHPDSVETVVCVTSQHRQMLDQVLNFFGIRPEHDLNIMRHDQTLFSITADALVKLEHVLNKEKPDLVFVQGDTTTAFAGALAGYYKKTKVAHLEAGLRSGDRYSPFPEEVNRLLIGRVADFHFAPTEQARLNLENEGITDKVFVVGNTVIDGLLWGLDIIKKQDESVYAGAFKTVDFGKKVVLVTGHRRESFGGPFEDICGALKELALSEKVEIVYPVHLNPNVREPVNRILKGVPGVHLIEPLEYPYLIWLMNRSYLVLTDSGGIQEEAPSLGKPVLVMRDVTERMEGVDAGTARLVGTSKGKILSEARALLNDASEYEKMSKAVNPYGDGTTSRKIVDYFLNNAVL